MGDRKLDDVLNDQAMEPVQAQELEYNMTWKTKYGFVSKPLTVSSKQLFMPAISDPKFVAEKSLFLSRLCFTIHSAFLTFGLDFFVDLVKCYMFHGTK